MRSSWILIYLLISSSIALSYFQTDFSSVDGWSLHSGSGTLSSGGVLTGSPYATFEKDLGSDFGLVKANISISLHNLSTNAHWSLFLRMDSGSLLGVWVNSTETGSLRETVSGGITGTFRSVLIRIDGGSVILEALSIDPGSSGAYPGSELLNGLDKFFTDLQEANPYFMPTGALIVMAILIILLMAPKKIVKIPVLGRF